MALKDLEMDKMIGAADDARDDMDMELGGGNSLRDQIDALLDDPELPEEAAAHLQKAADALGDSDAEEDDSEEDDFDLEDEEDELGDEDQYSPAMPE